LEHQVDAAQLKVRTREFGVRAIRLVRALPRTVEARVIGEQLLRSSTGVGANYRAACRARSKAEFAAKMGVVEEEADESAYWLELVIEAGLLDQALVQPLLQEATELAKIAMTSRKTADSHRRQSAIPNPQSAMGKNHAD
jgi:four helix bundle protein